MSMSLSQYRKKVNNEITQFGSDLEEILKRSHMGEGMLGALDQEIAAAKHNAQSALAALNPTDQYLLLVELLADLHAQYGGEPPRASVDAPRSERKPTGLSQPPPAIGRALDPEPEPEPETKPRASRTKAAARPKAAATKSRSRA